jgi:hypothetical protein
MSSLCHLEIKDQMGSIFLVSVFYLFLGVLQVTGSLQDGVYLTDVARQHP